jgi:hypothetical protein
MADVAVDVLLSLSDADACVRRAKAAVEAALGGGSFKTMFMLALLEIQKDGTAQSADLRRACVVPEKGGSWRAYLDHAEGRGEITIRKDPEDARALKLKITKVGKENLKAVREILDGKPDPQWETGDEVPPPGLPRR